MAKVAILIDGGYFLKRLPSVRRDINASDPAEVAGAIRQLVRSHLSQLNDIHRTLNFISPNHKWQSSETDFLMPCASNLTSH